MKCILYLFAILFTICALAGCNKDNDNTTGQETDKTNQIVDFRLQYLGNFQFTTITESWMLGQPTNYDTSIYNGIIRKYDFADSQNDLYYGSDTNENANEKITIEFKLNTKITSLINLEGKLITKTGYHYGHTGEFTSINTVEFIISGLGGLGGGYNYKVRGIRY